MKKIALAVGTLALAGTLLTGCGNYQVLDTTYNYDKAEILIKGEWKVVELKSWKDYEGEQLQVTFKGEEGWETRLVSSLNCTLIKSK